MKKLIVSLATALLIVASPVGAQVIDLSKINFSLDVPREGVTEIESQSPTFGNTYIETTEVWISGRVGLSRVTEPDGRVKFLPVIGTSNANFSFTGSFPINDHIFSWKLPEEISVFVRAKLRF